MYFLNKIRFKNSHYGLFDIGSNWQAKNHSDLIRKIESFIHQKIIFIEYQKTIQNEISCIDTFNY
tara:strand:+ start:3270 stop:3464 length:195 start_codon:yes stop_codon:yes gene_type:complete